VKKEVKFSLRTHFCGNLRKEHVGEKVVVFGWVHRRRDHGGLIFIDLRDKSGIVQVVADPLRSKDAFSVAEDLGGEFVVKVEGEVLRRPEGTENPALPTGEVEIRADSIDVLSTAETPPFEIENEAKVDEMLRLKYRYLDLRRPVMTKNLIFRHRVVEKVRNFLNNEGFIEVETPYLTKSTPEGARDYLVPSRIHPGHFYALAQSPQLFKQILMVSGFERYYQLARCFRDEDLRRDRQPEHTQIDVEMSFCGEEEVMSLIEEMMREVFSLIGEEIKIPFPRLSYDEAMLKYGTDKPDLRYPLYVKDLSDGFRKSEFRVLRKELEEGGVVRGIKAKASFSRRDLDELTEFVKSEGLGGLTWLKRENEWKSPVVKFFSSSELEFIRKKLEVEKGEFAFLLAGKEEGVSKVAGLLREKLAEKLGLKKEGYKLIWINNFPLFEWSEEEKRYVSKHHPFTRPTEETLIYLEKEPLKARAYAYDLVINGVEVGGGSLRIYQPELQKKVFKVLGMGDMEVQEKFGFLLEAFRFGVPPHGGIALGLDRLVMILSGCESIRDVIAFPKTQSAVCLMTKAPSTVDKKQLRELHLKLD
jgi:aspartyl-tRNA synthetase